jgi:hypothetical protein
MVSKSALNKQYIKKIHNFKLIRSNGAKKKLLQVNKRW